MKIFFDYLKDKKIFLISFPVIITFFVLVSFFDRANRMLNTNILYIVIVSTIIFLVFILIDFLLHYRYLVIFKKAVTGNGENWESKLPAPVDSMERQYYDLFKRLHAEKIEELEEYRLKKIEDIEFLTSWIHQIKNPISATKLVIENYTGNTATELLKSIEEEIDKIDDYVQKVLYYSRLDDFSQDYIIEDIDLKELINERIKRFSQYFIAKKIILKLSGIKETVKSDRKSLGFIIDQIISNSLKYTGENGTINIFTRENTNEVVLSIKDNGTGIRNEDISRVFKKTFTGSTGRTLYSSTGFGLYLSKKLAEKLNHYIEIDSEYKKGTTVHIHFPINASYYNISKM